jgi:prepilin-type N-terminal cleavage/methylation domain-containing protein
MRRRGFTLLELTLVTTIAGLLLALVAPRFLALRNVSSVRATMGELGATFSAARQHAITRRAMVAIVLDTTNGSVELRSGGQTILRRSLKAVYGISLGANRDSVVYDPRGLGYGVSNLSVTVRRGAIVDTLTMSRLGRVRW